MTKSAIPDSIESARKILNAPASKIPELEAAEAVLSHVLAETDAELEGMASRRKAILAADAPAPEIDKQLERHDETVRALTRRNEVAAAISTKLATRIAVDREAERADKQRANYAAARELHDATRRRVKEFLDRFGPESRKMMREYGQSESKTAAANCDLPPGALPIPSIEAERRGELRARETTVREFKAFVDGRRFVAEQNHVQAAERKDGKWDVWLPAGTTGAGSYFVCSLEDYVEAVIEADATPWPEFLASSLSVPAFFVTQHPGWRPLANDLGPAFPSQIAAAIDKLESLPQPQFPARVETRTMSLANWRGLNGETIEADPPRAQLAAE